MKNAKVKSPVTKGVAKVPVIMQLEALECGAASLAMVAAYYGKWVTLEQARSDCGVSRDGSSAVNIVKAGLLAKSQIVQHAVVFAEAVAAFIKPDFHLDSSPLLFEVIAL